jgi:hypothetical protein
MRLRHLEDTCPNPGPRARTGGVCLVGYTDPDGCHDGFRANGVCDPMGPEPDLTTTPVTLSGLTARSTGQGVVGDCHGVPERGLQCLSRAVG